MAEGWIGRYAIQARLGEGGMAETWLCRAPDGFSAPVVVKTLRPGCRGRQYQTMFRDEAMIGMALHHPNVAQVFEFGTAADGPYLVQEYVDGPNLVQLIHAQQLAGGFDLRLAARIVADVAVALDHAYHARDGEGRPRYVVHRDVSPSNVLIGVDGVTRLIDFGVAMYVGREARTESGVVKGKLQFMAPEVLLDQDWSHRSDLYSLGMVLHWLLVGRTPTWRLGDAEAEGGRPEGDVLLRLRGELTPASTHRPDLPRALEEIVGQCLHVQPSRRFARGAYLAEALEDWMRCGGGLVSDAEVAGKLGGLFRDPNVDWRACYDFTVAVSLAQALQTPLLAPGRSQGPRRGPATPLRLAFGALVLAVGSGLLGLIAAILLVSQGTARADERAVGDLDSVARHLAGLEARFGDDPRRSELLGAIRDVRDALADSPGLALEMAQGLAEVHPNAPEVQAILDEVRHTVERHGAGRPAARASHDDILLDRRGPARGGIPDEILSTR